MRAIVTAATAGLLAGCTSTFELEPQLTVSPYYAVYQLRGDVALQSSPVSGDPPQDNPPRQLSEFGQEHHDDDVGLRGDFGDGFAGLRVDYYRAEMSSMSPGVIPSYWGELLPGDLVLMDVAMDELRLSWVEPVTSFATTFRDEDLTFRFAAGGLLTYRDMKMRARTDDGARRQNVAIDGETVSATGRMRATWRNLAFDLDYAVCPDLVLGGDLGEVNQDLELRFEYAVPLRAVTFYAGYRYSTMDADGRAGILGYAATLELDGFQFGMTVTL